MTWTIRKPTRDGYYWVRNAYIRGVGDQPEPCITEVYGFADGTPTVALPSEQECSDLCDVDAEWCGPLMPPS